MRQRARLYRWRAFDSPDPSADLTLVPGQLVRVLPDRTTRIVPHPTQRVPLVTDMHSRTGHFGMRRTMGMLSSTDWWHGMGLTVQQVCAGCPHCRQVGASFTLDTSKLCPLPIEGFMYRWGVDLCGPFPTSTKGSKYVMIAIKYFSKHAEIIPIPNSLSSTTATAFLQHECWHALAVPLKSSRTKDPSSAVSSKPCCKTATSTTAPRRPRTPGLTAWRSGACRPSRRP